MNRRQRQFQIFASKLYRKIIFPFKRRTLEKNSSSIILPGAYLYGASRLEGHNYIGMNTELNHVTMGFGSYINNNGQLTNTVIGKYTSIGTDVKSVIGRHPVSENISTHPAFYSKDAQMGFTYAAEDSFEETVWIDKDEGVQIAVGNDVWIGNDVRIMEGVSIKDGAIVAAGSIVTKDVEPYEVVAGIPARVIKKRFADADIEKLLRIKWWELPEDELKVRAGEFKDPKKFLS